MAERPRKRTVRFSPSALVLLDQIWEWNAQKYGADHADEYIAFRRSEAEHLADDWLTGRPV
ncbi:MAG TPA: hypothetical protein VL992_04795 [Tepidisphaeraceae bacterium]|nr:hypothetical protein [Tepidisphaeraceae bacterium]